MSCFVSALLVAALGWGPAPACGGLDKLDQRDSGQAVSSSQPLGGEVIVIDAGHQLGNHNFPAEINRLVEAGGFTKPCNTTGTATNGGYPEATLNFAIARSVQVRLERLGATVLLSRQANTESSWGPCVDTRGRFGERVGADLVVSLHA